MPVDGTAVDVIPVTDRSFEKPGFLKRINLIPAVQSPLQKNFCSRSTQINFRTSPSRPTEGRFAIVTDAGRDAVDAAAFKRAT